jgi:hypothetical protein
MTIFTKGIYDVAADIARSAGHKDLHLHPFPAYQMYIRVEPNFLSSEQAKKLSAHFSSPLFPPRKYLDS